MVDIKSLMLPGIRVSLVIPRILVGADYLDIPDPWIVVGADYLDISSG